MELLYAAWKYIYYGRNTDALEEKMEWTLFHAKLRSKVILNLATS
jgi:hypothetical protein